MATVFPFPWLYDYSPGAQFELEPQSIYANTNFKFVKFFDLYPATLYTLKYAMVPFDGATLGAIKFQSVPLNGGNWHFVSVLPAVTITWKPALYAWQCFAELLTDATQRDYISRGTIMVNADYSTAGAVDTRGKWQKILDEVDAMILLTAGDSHQEITIGRGTISGQAIKGWDRADLINFRDYAAEQAGNEKRIKAAKGGAPNPRYKFATMTGGQTIPGSPVFPSFP